MKGLSHTEDRPNTGPVPMAAQSASPAVTATYGFSRILEMPPNTRIFSPLVLVEQGVRIDFPYSRPSLLLPFAAGFPSRQVFFGRLSGNKASEIRAFG